MQAFINSLMELATAVGGKIILALVVLIVGSAVIKKVVKLVAKSKGMNKVEGTVRSFIVSFVRIGLYVVLVISIIGILGVPMASVVAVLASAGVAVGLALQGALSNLAGGIMLMIFHPFRQGDYIEAAGVDGVVQEVTLFYTVLLSLDNKRITVPNGSLMNANVVNYSSEALRRVDLTFGCAKSEAPAQIQNLMMEAVKANGKVLADPAPFARLSGGSNEAMEFTVRAWCKGEDYWDVYFDLTQAITEAMGAKGVQAPAVRVVAQ
ncbi:MAG: mechanosensitive ion channel [Ruminiclostridium sp.]|nr:mechanosensitive ion channel [Ruminiclostridium sp.]